ncbi:hypothetical protein G7Y89_g11753 [Cudoniella acicularis]|uniref:BTB domain-containing protein n=1 Tax=Cudoniella acicularis TaxID=354080 RepID=A0A8H4RBE6_9HELO|nr:hypothetical protein G7Y89_g11753 [Cudoniella acicularis]
MSDNTNEDTEMQSVQGPPTDSGNVANPTAIRPTFDNIFGTEMVDLFVGPEKKRFHVHKSVLCQRVPYFRAMFESEFIEAQENLATFPEDNAESFDVLLIWIYTGKLQQLRRDSVSNKWTWSPIDFFQLAEKLCLPIVMDRTMDTMRAIDCETHMGMGLGSISNTYSKTGTKSAMRKYAIDCLLFIFFESKRHQWPVSTFQDFMKDNPDMAVDFMEGIRAVYDQKKTRLLNPSNTKIPNCQYHCHGADEPCPHSTH